MSNNQNVGSVITNGPVNGPITNVFNGSPTIQSFGAIDWSRLSEEVAQLNARQLPTHAREFAAEMKNACEKKDESKVKRVCGKLGSFVLAFAESLGLELIASLITACIMG